MGGPNDQGMSSMWFHFEFKILELLTLLASAALALALAALSKANDLVCCWLQ